MTLPLYRSLAPFAFGAAGLVFAAGAFAAPLTISEPHDHGAWQALTLDDGDKRHFRAVEATSYSDATLSVNATQGVCHLPWLEMRVTLEETQTDDRAVNLVPARLRVDREPLVDTMAEFIVERGDDGFYSHFYLGELDTLLSQMSGGEKLFIGFDQGEAEPWTMTFDLDGAGEALAEMRQRCADA
ncbi:type VI secretion protein [Vreelandella malpeensis]|uniref:Uncharacterized protein n=1 Tax=Vreelandella malpeensis TaxID=1172368 RepID=A0ABS8DQ98_9GAMM|nr:type VI secretion protein [Halomonas malpeensis]MCB8888479.1 hypothetical protein [Halomonas malpeensis]